MALSLKERIAQEANALGFEAVRFAGADPPPGAGAALDTFLADGRHGDMAWLAANCRAPQDPRALWPEVKHHHARHELRARDAIRSTRSTSRSRGAISVYAQGKDYHDVLKAKLKQLARASQRTRAAR